MCGDELGGRCWRARFLRRLVVIAARYPPRLEVDLEALADMLLPVTGGGIILSKVIGYRTVLPRQVMLYRSLVKTCFWRAEARCLTSPTSAGSVSFPANRRT
jgi:hypothetical protein